MYALNLNSAQDTSSDTYATAFPFSSTFTSFNIKLNSDSITKSRKNEFQSDDSDTSFHSSKKQKVEEKKLANADLVSDRFSGTISSSFNRWGLSKDEIKSAKEQASKSKIDKCEMIFKQKEQEVTHVGFA